MRPFPSSIALVLALCLGAAGPGAAKPPLRPAESLRAATQTSTRGQAMVVAANPHAVEAGLAVLRRGGTAADAAVAVQAVLGLVEPQSSGLGGGSFMVFYDGRTREATSYNGRETAPAAAGPGLFLGEDGRPLSFREAVLSGRSTGVPGAIAMLHQVQADHGRLAWSSLFADAARLADSGFTVSPRLSRFINGRDFAEAGAPDVARYFSRAGGGRLQTGDLLKNPAYARSARAIAADWRTLYDGPLAAEVLARTHEGPRPGALTAADMAGYKPIRSPAICGPYRVWIVCTADLPSGGAPLLEGLGILERTDIARRGPTDPQAWYLFAEASRLMYADRDRYFGDPRFVSVPVGGLLDPAYLDARARLIGATAGPPPEPGKPKGAPAVAADATHEVPGTSHMVIVDRWGNVVSMTTTVESIFGSGRMVGGFFLNNQLTDFSLKPTDAAGRPVANAPGPGKRPRSSMAPVVILDRQGRFVAASGSAGGTSILAYNLKTVVAMLDWKMTPADAVALPNLIAMGPRYFAEVDKFSPVLQAGLKARGITLQPGQGEDSGLTAAMVRDGVLVGGADPRREGVARRP